MHIIAKYAQRVEIATQAIADLQHHIPAHEQRGFRSAVAQLYQAAEDLREYADEIYGTTQEGG